jgi:predicted transcriptional regulator of viral defense system
VGEEGFEYRNKLRHHPPAGARVAALAGRQHGVASTGQLRECGLSPAAIRRWVQAGSLHPLHRGVYAVGHRALSLNSRQLAAVFAAGRSALLSHRSAGRNRDLIRHTGAIEVSTPRSRKPREGFVLHRSRSLTEADHTLVAGIPTTSVARTLVDLAEVLNENRLAKAVHEAEVQRVFDLSAIDEVLTRVPGRTGRHRLHRVLEAYREAPITRSHNERRFLEICETHGLPMPLSNASRAGYEPDFLWPDHGLAVEMDDPAIHYTIQSYYADRRRDRALAPHNIQVLRVTPLDLENERALAEEMRGILAAKAA